MAFYLTKGNADDQNLEVMTAITKDVFGKLFGDKGYISKTLKQLLFEDGIQLITKVGLFVLINAVVGGYELFRIVRCCLA